MSSVCKCDCGKLSSSMNDKNWNRHINSCKVRKFKRNSHDIKSFFSGNKSKKSKLIHQITAVKNTIFDVNNDLNEDQSTPVNKESLVKCEIQKDTEISSCLQNKEFCLINQNAIVIGCLIH
ncbi:uncharacterized protein LOC112681540 [Sipha flava]|uniref:Uncharacterized protein LOC112681540 n=1 Tax=Sipha flava TaxID=143950 RepID=A0A8B8FB66_9HEMI|nr:uncharacterized protein LOC112681540 [Sipha flava]